MSIPKFYEIHKPLLECLSDGKPYLLKELMPKIAKYFHLENSEITELLPSGRQTVFANRVGWARTYLKKAGLIDSPSRAMVQITTQGKKVLADNPPVIDSEYLLRFEGFREFQKRTSGGTQETKTEQIRGNTPDDTFEESFKRINDSLADNLLEEVVKLSPIFLSS